MESDGLRSKDDTFSDTAHGGRQLKNLNNLVDLSVKLVEIGRYKVYGIVYDLHKLVFVLSLATSIQRVFSTINFVKTKLRNKTGDSLLNDCLFTSSSEISSFK